MSTSSSTTFWNEYVINNADVEHLYGYLLEHPEPTVLETLLSRLVEHRIEQEQKRRVQLTADAKFYQPRETYDVGQLVTFTALNNRQAVVQAVRPSDNSRLASFQVIAVRFNDDGSTREFASVYPFEHPLNDQAVMAMGGADLEAAEVLEQFGASLKTRLEARLRADKEFVHQDDKWLLRGLLSEVNQGHINLAEAAIEQNSEAMTTSEIGRVLEMVHSGKESNALFSLENALRRDEQFEDVGPRGERRWYLTRLEPESTRVLPPLLDLSSQTAAPALPSALETIYTDLERQTESDADAVVEASEDVTLVLTFPHRRAGTLPINSAIRHLLPGFDNPRVKITLVDGQSNTRMPAWIVRDGQFIFGLGAWYDSHKLHPGALVSVRRGYDANSLIVDYSPQRERSLWVRVARTQGGRLTFAQEKKPLAHKYDEEMLIMIGDAAGLDSVTQSSRHRQAMELWLVEIFPELAKLSAGGRVHAKTLYSAVNFGKRTTPGLFFSTLASSLSVASVGGGYYVLEAVKDLVS